MDTDLALQAILGRGDFVGGIDNEALDFSQLEAFINSEGPPGGAQSYFGESLNAAAPSASGGNVIVENKRPPGHSLPDSPPDSGSEHPYSPQETCEPPQETIYTTLEQPLYNNLILGHSIVVQDMEPATLHEVAQPNRQILIQTDTAAGCIQDSYCNTNPLELEENSIQAVYTNLQNVPKKRKLSQDVALVKSEPEICPPGQLSPTGPLSSTMDDDYAASETCLSDSQYQCIRFQAFQQSAWHVLCDQNLAELPSPHYRVDADKGFNFSNADDAFVCQKKNHFQITCHVQLVGDAQFVKTAEGLQKIASFHLHFYGVKHDCPTQTIRVEQSQSDRSKKPFHPVLVELVNSQVTKVTVGRLHFSETTSNNMRKKGKPNPEQRYFQLVVGLHAHTAHGNFAIASHASQRIIVRASNPGQFESDVETLWQKGHVQESIFHTGKVGINTDKPDESLVVHGNLKITGHIIQPSDVRFKKNIVECDSAQQLRNVQKMRVVRYEYESSLASKLNRTDRTDTGVIAQEVARILPEAVSPAGDLVLDDGLQIDNFLVVNKERIFMENIGAVKELCKVTDNLETRIDHLERINKRLNKMKREDNGSGSTTKKTMRMELCSNKLIQIVIVVLVLIMAFCLAAITTLYLMEAAKHSQSAMHARFQAIQNAYAFHQKRPSPKTFNKVRSQWQDSATTRPFVKGAEISMKALDPSKSLGRPPYCDLEMDQESANLCQIYCCKLLDNQEAMDGVFNEEKQNRTALLEKSNKVMVKPFNGNNIDAKLVPRKKRDSDDIYENIYENIAIVPESAPFAILIEGRHFNASLGGDFLVSVSNSNFTYVVPISKYMADDFIHVTFKSSMNSGGTVLHSLERCYNEHKQHECPLYWERLSKANEDDASMQIGQDGASATFQVDMVGFLSKIMTYRASLVQNKNSCLLSSTKLGIEYVEYNFNFYRTCDE